MLVVALPLTVVPTARVKDAEAVTFPSGVQTGFQIDGNKIGGSPPNTFDWDDFLQPPPTATQTPSFVPTEPYTTVGGLRSSGIFGGGFSWDDGTFNNCAGGQDQSANAGSATANTNPWVPRPANVQDKNNLCSAGYAMEALADETGLRHFLLYGYFTRRTGGSASASTFTVFEGTAPGRCDDLMLDVHYPGGATQFLEWVPTAGDDCANPDGPGSWLTSERRVDFVFAMGNRTEAPPVGGNQENTFGEYAIDLTTAGLFGDTQCSTYDVSSLLSRSSTSISSSLADMLVNAPAQVELSNCGTLTITKQAPGQTADDFGFTVLNGSSRGVVIPPEQTSIVDTLRSGETKTYTNVLSSSLLTLEETRVPPPWEMTRAECSYTDAAGRRRTIDVTDPSTPFVLLGGGQTDCVISNDAAIVTVSKQTVPDWSDQTFDMAVGADHEAVLGHGDRASFAVPAGAPLTIEETAVPGWMTPEFECTDGTRGTGFSATVQPVVGENIECVFTNTRQATVTIQKRVPIGSAGTPFGFSGDLGDFVLTPTEPAGATIALGSAQFVVDPGTYSVTETIPEEYVLAALACWDPPHGVEEELPTDPPRATVTAHPGSEVTCSFDDIAIPEGATLTVSKATTPMVEWDVDVPFAVTGGPAEEPFDASFALNTIGEDWSWVQQNLEPGEYMISEEQLPGWVLDDVTCVNLDGEPVDVAAGEEGSVTVDLGEGDVVSCLFTNRATLARATVTKTVVDIGPSLPWTFDVSLSPVPGLTTTVSGTGPGTDTAMWTDLVPGQQYVIRETVRDGWDQGAITCTGGQDLDTDPLTVTFVAEVGQQLECRMTNTGRRSSFSIRKVTAGVSDDYEWSFNAQIIPAPPGTTNPVTVSGVGQSAYTTTFQNLLPGQSYEVTEIDLPGHVTQALETCTGGPVEQIPRGFRLVAPLAGTVTCSLTNLVAPAPATITKTVGEGDGDGSFMFDVVALGTGEDPVTVNVTTANGTGIHDLPGLIPGVRYSLTERPQVGWIEEPALCTVTPVDGEPYVIPDVTDFEVPGGVSVACAAHNELAPATVAFTKTTTGIANGLDWTFDAVLTPPEGVELDNPVQVVSGTGPTSSGIAWTDLEPGVYTLEELVPAGWVAGPITCGEVAGQRFGSTQLIIEPGRSYGCSATNTAQTGSLTVQKRTAGIGPAFDWAFDLSIEPVPGGGQPPTATLTGTGPGLGAATHTWHSLMPGAVYSISEAVPTGWTNDSISCGGAADITPLAWYQVIPQPGQALVCTADNTAAPVAGTLAKTTIGGNGDFDVVLDTVPASGAPTTITVTTTNGSGTAGLPTLLPGTRYSLVESAADGWEQTRALTCTRTPLGGGTAVPIANLADFTVEIGDTLACTAENRALGRVILFKEVHGTGPDQLRDFGFTSNIPGHESFTVEDVKDDGNLVEYVIDDVVPGEGFFYFQEDPDVGDPPTVLADLACTWGGVDHSGTPADREARRMAFEVLPGETTECYFTNAVPGSIVLIKRSVPANYNQDFDFRFDGPETAGVDESFVINSDPGVAGALRSWTNLIAGRYVLTEGAMPAGWSFNTANDATFCNTPGGWALDPAAQSITIDLAPNAVITCFFSNLAETATVTVTKRTDGLAAGTGWQFPLTISPSAGLSPGGQQQVTGTAPGTGTVTWTGLLPGVTYTLAEPAVGGYSSAWDCGIPDANAAQPGFQFVPTPGLDLSCTLVNTAVPAALSFTKTVSGVGGNLAWSFQLDLSPEADPAGSRTASGTGNMSSAPVSWTGLVPGRTYTLTETGGGGWARGIILCPGLTNLSPTPTTSFVFVPQAGQSIECGTSNAGIASRATIAKETAGVAAGVAWSFPLTISPAASPVATRTFTGTGSATSAPLTWTGLVPGVTYTITEAVPPGWTFDGIECTGVETTAVAGGVSFVAPLDTTVACTTRNAAQAAQVSVTKTVEGVTAGLPWSFDVALSPTATPATPQQVTGTGPTTSDPVTFTDLVPGDLYTLSETVPAGWTSSGPTCAGVVDVDGAEPGLQFRPSVGQAISCNIVNTAESASASFTKTVAGVDDDFTWTFPVTLDPAAGGVGAQDVSGTGNTSDTVTWSGLVPGQTYALTEQSNGFSAGEFECSVDAEPIESGVAFTPAPGDDISCTVTNTAVAAGVSVVKTVTGVAADHPWSIDLTLVPPADPPQTRTASGTGPTTSEPVAWTGLVPGRTYTITENAPGWTLAEFSCDAPGATGTNNGVTFIAQPGAQVSCEAGNGAVAGAGELVKIAVGGDGEFGFLLTPAGGTAQEVTVRTSDTSGEVQLPPLTPGLVYALAEIPEPGWRVASPLACALTPLGGQPSPISPSAIRVDVGGVVSCTITNEALGEIVIVKDVDGPDATFSFTGTWLDPPAFAISTSDGSGSLVTRDVPAGEYTVTERGQPGFEPTSLACVGGESSAEGVVGTIDLRPGQTVTCTYGNTAWGVLVVHQSTVPPGATRAFDFALGPDGRGRSSFSLTDAGPPFTSSPLAPGDYTVTQADVPGWPLTTLECTGSSGEPAYDGASATVRVGAGDTVTCHYTNTREPQIGVQKTVSVQRSSLGGAGRFGYHIAVHAIGETAQVYDLADELRYPPGVTIASATAVSLDGFPTNPAWNGVDETLIASGIPIAPAESHTYAVTVAVEVPATLPDEDLQCGTGADAGGGLSNDAVVLADGVVDDRADTCIPLPGPPPGPTPPPGPAPPSEQLQVAGPMLPSVPLPLTGANVALPLAGGLVAGLITIGTGLVLAARRRRRV